MSVSVVHKIKLDRLFSFNIMDRVVEGVDMYKYIFFYAKFCMYYLNNVYRNIIILKKYIILYY